MLKGSGLLEATGIARATSEALYNRTEFPLVGIFSARAGHGFARKWLRILLGPILGVAVALVSTAGPRAENLTPAPRDAARDPASSRPFASTVRLDQGEDWARLEFALSAPVDVSAFLLAGPDRVIVDLPDLDFRIDPGIVAAPSMARPPEPPRAKPGSARGEKMRRDGGPEPLSRSADPETVRAHRGRVAGLVASYRFGRLGLDKSRVIIDLAAPARILRATCETVEGAHGAKLVILLGDTDRATFRAAVQNTRAAMAESWSGPRAGRAIRTDEPIVVIDPGHGGIDSGAIVNGSVEKDLVLGFAKSVAARLAADGRVAAILTRRDDTFVPLTERIRLARESGAGLFVSIHADSLSDATDVAGATVYTVSERASDAAAARLAEKENDADAAAGLDRPEEASDVSDILQDLARRETRALSHVFARTLLTYWKVAGRLNKNPQRAAGFVVLKAPDVPSVLLELGYLTNAKDDLALSSADWRDKAAARVAEAITAYFTARENAVASTLPAGSSPLAGEAPGPRR